MAHEIPPAAKAQATAEELEDRVRRVMTYQITCLLLISIVFFPSDMSRMAAESPKPAR
jgi:hypothetical protein